MKRIAYLFGVVVAAITASCLKVEDTPQFAKSNTTLAVTATATTISVTAKDSTNAALTLNWNDPKYSLGLSKSLFTVYVSPTGTNFATFGTKSFSGVLTGSLLGKEINGIALKLGGVVGQTITLDVKVVASQENNNDQKVSNVLQVTYSPYGDVALTATSTAKALSPASANNATDTLTWTQAFVGYSGVKTYQLQYAKGSTSFASPVSTAVSGFSLVYTQSDLNKIALGVGGLPNVATPVDFRVVATNELGNKTYSNVVTLTITPWSAANSIDVIGDATPGGWNTGTEMYRVDPVNKPAEWTIITKLIGGNSVKFRADQQWNTNWGASNWPSGTGTQNGNNIPVGGSTGYYQITFNAGTGAYSFTQVSIPTGITAMGVIGNFTNWSADTLLTQSGTDPNVWTGKVTLQAGDQFKFRMNQQWTTSWGSGTLSPKGYAGWLTTNNGSNLVAPVTARYFVYINAATGEFFMGNLNNNPNAGTPYGKIGLVGDVVGSWSNDVFFVQNPQNPYSWSLKVCDSNHNPVTLPAAAGKVRADAAWNTSWGGSSFPNGVGTTNNDPNISVQTGTPQILFNSATGEYTFIY